MVNNPSGERGELYVSILAVPVHFILWVLPGVLLGVTAWPPACCDVFLSMKSCGNNGLLDVKHE